MSGDADSGDAGVLAQPKRLGLLGYLVINGRGRWVARQELLGLFWPESDEARARKALSQTLWVLRNQFGEDLIRKRGSADIALEPDRLSVDVWTFLDALDAGDDEGAVNAYGGEFLPGLVLTGAPAFERWLEEQRSVLRRKARDAAWRLAERASPPEGVRWARAGYEAAGPHDEEAARRLMDALAAAGDRRGALDLYDAMARELASDGDEPQPETQALAERLRPPPGTPEDRNGPVARSAAVRGPAPTDTATANATREEPAQLRTPAPSAPRPRNLWAMAALLVSALVPLVLGIQAMRQQGAATVRTASRIAVLPFHVEGNPALAYLGSAVVDLLSARLDGAAELNSVDPAAVLSDSDAKSGRPSGALLRRLGAELAVTGTVVGLGEAVEIRATLLDAQGRPLQQAHVVAEAEAELSMALDEVALDLLTGILEGRPSGLDYGAAQETRSLEALKAYLRGEAAFRSFRLEEATEAFRQAVALDTAFALAYFRLNRLGDWLEDGSLVAALDQALAHRERLPRRQQRLLDAHVAYWRTSVPEGIRLLEEAVASYPTDADAWFQLGEARFHGGPRTGHSILESEDAFRRALELNPHDHRAALHLVGLAAYRGDSREAARLAALFPDPDPARRFQTSVLSKPSATSLESLVADLEALPLSLTPAVLSPSDFLERPDLLMAAGARLEAEGSTDTEWFDGLGYQLLGAEAGGRPSVVARLLQRLEARSPGQDRDFRSYLASLPWHPAPDADWEPDIPAAEIRSRRLMLSEGILALRAGRNERYDSILSELQQDEGPPSQLMASYVLRAEAALAAGRPEEGLALLDEGRRDRTSLNSYPTVMTMPHAGERFLRGRLLEAAGRPEEALDWYGTMAAPVTYSLPYAAPAHLARARILDALGRDAEAAEARRRARHLLSDAEPGALEARATFPLPPAASPPRRR